MRKITPEQWKEVFELLDAALDLPVDARDAWVDRLDETRAHLRPALRHLLAKHAARQAEGFLSELPRFTSIDGDVSVAQTGAPRADDQIGPYRLVRELGRGGMGTVWLAERIDGAFKRSVALKLPHVTWLGGLAERMARERNILAELEHPNIARLYDAGVDELGRPFMAMEYVEGQPIDVYCRERRLSIRQCLALVLQVAKAMTYAHTRLIVHRDLKPANILVTAEGSVRLLDFGIAKLLAGDGEQDANTQFAARALTPDYAAPEQIRGQAIGTGTDVYSLAVVCYELLTGARPYRLKHHGVAELEQAITQIDPPAASEATEDATRKRLLKGDLDAILNKALKKDPAERYATIDAFAQDIERHLAGVPVLARPDSRAYRMGRFMARHKVGTFASVAILLAITAGTSVAVWQALEARAQARRSDFERDQARRATAREEAVRVYLTRMFRASIAEKGAGETSAKTMLDRSAQRVLNEYRDEPYLAGKVVETLSDLYSELEDVEGQVPLLEGFLAQAGPEADPEAMAAVRQRLANVELLRGHTPKAAELLGPAEAFWMSNPQRYAEQLLEGMVVRGRLQRAQGDLAGSIATYERAIRARTLRSGLNHAETAILYNSLAITYTASNRLEDALKAYRQALAIHQALDQSEDVDALVMRANMGTLAYRVGRIAEAEGLLKSAFEKQQALSGDSAAVAAAMGQYGALQSVMQRHESALGILRDAERMAISFAGKASPVAIQNRLLTSEGLMAAGQYDAAGNSLNENLRLAEAQFGATHPFVLRLKVAQARLSLARGEAAQALAQLEPLAPLLRAAGPSAQLPLGQALIAEGESLLALGRAADAIPLFTEALQVREPLLWAESWELAEAREGLGTALLATGNPRGKKLLERALMAYEVQLGPDHVRTRRARNASMSSNVNAEGQ